MLPEEATQEDYEAVPIEEFGAALLRGMGWKDGELAGIRKENAMREPVIFQPRPNLLGLGAKPMPITAKEREVVGRRKIRKPGEKR